MTVGDKSIATSSNSTIIKVRQNCISFQYYPLVDKVKNHKRDICVVSFPEGGGQYFLQGGLPLYPFHPLLTCDITYYMKNMQTGSPKYR